MLLKHVVLIMRIINIIINVDDIRQERSNGRPTLKLNKRFKETLLNKKSGTHVKESITFQALENNIVFLEVKLLSENPCKGWKIEYFPKVEDHLIQKLGNISIRYLVYRQKIHWWLVAESVLVWQQKNGEYLARKQLLNTAKLLPA